MATRNQTQQQKPAQAPSKAWPAKRKPSMRERYVEIQDLMSLTEELLAEIYQGGLSNNVQERAGLLHLLVKDANSQPPIFK
ncbi:hypothetical protein LMG31884_47120 (plasmid) [Xanthomonas hydrangeae]|uniref:hypothetical protein n=1 Tax=Xanthomonas hydrangeae TaxID=2775159 RepID=UPI001964C22B|nr:hypothetical protein LMG31884_47120 [Xanthomonas hydrangeae]CAD7740975.1 hypothetical protein LMG31884_47120 [Xanthomonas hydrangeae]CAD7747996.1 hypothetical protein LMG31887_46690 [Xanthomonas hydrangeae]CAD7747997.1 hypothetical protein LMG31887_46690 [Xanthomonas hydrangeae]CAD7748126.1 hypothetical protein LMG31885_44800 [Xanthomonas hydrangeae]